MTRRTLLSLLPGAAAAQVVSQSDREWNRPIPPVEILPGLFFVGAAGVSSYLFRTPQGSILLDSGFRETVPNVEASLKQLEVKPNSVRWLITSHAHYDHIGGIAALQRLTKGRLVASEPDADVYETGGRTAVNTPDRRFEPCKVDRRIRDGESVTIGNMSVTAHLTPGHTRGALTWTSKIAGRNVVFVGSGSVNSVIRLVNNPTYPNIAEDYRTTFRIMRSLPCDIWLTNHPFTFDFERKAQARNFVDPVGYRTFVDRMEQAFETQLREQSKA